MLPGRLAAEGEIFAPDVEVYQEILHRYAALNRADANEPASPFWTQSPTKYSHSDWPSSPAPKS